MDVDVPVPVVDQVRKLRDDNERDEGGDLFMQVDLPWELDPDGDYSHNGSSIVIDTNIVLQFLPLLRALYQHLESLPPSPLPSPTLIVPHRVLAELDGLKLSTRTAQHSHRPQSISVLAREATNWLLSVLPSPSSTASSPPTSHRRPFLRGQRRHESLLPFENGRRQAPTNDAEILDACLYFVQNISLEDVDGGSKSRVVLLSNDRNLCLQARIEGVETVEIGDSVRDGKDLLTLVDPAFARALTSSTSSPRLSQISRHAPPPPPSTTATKPPPASSSLSSMNLDTIPPISLTLLPSPTLLPPTSPHHIHHNILLLLSHLLSLPLYKHLYYFLLKEKKESQLDWMEDLGDWRYWEAEDCLKVLRRYWDEGGIRELCKRGFESDVEVTTVGVSNGVDVAAPKKEPTPPAIPKEKGSNRSTTSSRWSTRPPSPPPPPKPSSPPPPAPLPPAQKPTFRTPLPPPRRLSSLSSSLSSLEQSTNSTISPQTNTWSPSRWEAFLDALEDLLVAMLGGMMRAPQGEVAVEVKLVVRGWRNELRSLGVLVDV